MTPYWDFPQLLSLLLRLLHEGNLAKGRCEVMRVLGKHQYYCCGSSAVLDMLIMQ